LRLVFVLERFLCKLLLQPRLIKVTFEFVSIPLDRIDSLSNCKPLLFLNGFDTVTETLNLSVFFQQVLLQRVCDLYFREFDRVAFVLISQI
jgi:hypothetical protein